MPSGAFQGGVCFGLDIDASAAWCGANYPRVDVDPSNGGSLVTRCTAYETGAGASIASDGNGGGRLEKWSYGPGGQTIGRVSDVYTPLLFSRCDTDKDYTGGLSLITKSDAITVAWGIVIAWVAAAGVVWVGKQFRG